MLSNPSSRRIMPSVLPNSYLPTICTHCIDLKAHCQWLKSREGSPVPRAMRWQPTLPMNLTRYWSLTCFVLLESILTPFISNSDKPSTTCLRGCQLATILWGSCAESSQWEHQSANRWDRSSNQGIGIIREPMLLCIVTMSSAFFEALLMSNWAVIVNKRNTVTGSP